MSDETRANEAAAESGHDNKIDYINGTAADGPTVKPESKPESKPENNSDDKPAAPKRPIFFGDDWRYPGEME